MWINRVLAQDDIFEKATIATVIDVTENKITASCHAQALNVPVINPCGIHSMPSIGDEVFLIPTMDGSYVCLGTTVNNNSLIKSKLKISSNGGYISFNDNGDVCINGVLITKNGVIQGGK